VGASRADGTAQFLDLAVDFPELFAWSLLVSICRHRDLAFAPKSEKFFPCRAPHGQ
jgi:hypothetical protein